MIHKQRRSYLPSFISPLRPLLPPTLPPSNPNQYVCTHKSSDPILKVTLNPLTGRLNMLSEHSYQLPKRESVSGQGPHDSLVLRIRTFQIPVSDLDPLTCSSRGVLCLSTEKGSTSSSRNQKDINVKMTLLSQTTEERHDPCKFRSHGHGSCHDRGSSTSRL